MTVTSCINVSATLRALLENGPLKDTLSKVAASIRREPDNAAHRLLYFDLLCLTGGWEKALPSLQNAVGADASLTPLAYVYRQLVQAEVFRASVFAGQHHPALPDPCPAWMLGMLEALRAQSQGDTDLADSLRGAALQQAPESPGEAHLAYKSQREQSFRWLADSDSRLGPVLEVHCQGRYQWLPLHQVRRVDIQEPCFLRDLIWLPVTLVLNDGAYPAFVPGRYPGSEMTADALALGRETHWQDVGDTGVTALGQKTFISDTGDLPLYDLRRLVLTPPVAEHCA